ncbi:MAG: T9SS type A sorting domain-containing protein [Chryseobacterium sp.]|jgi:hypothetical protein|uniref:T9SS type A sorting domain-containing protein n=1 Tax=Chryseobacterium sp. TaxID=1871047 RepID=UPI00282DCF0A|nr:T9SS type A sorting domain-containing protein [Chryseobacterium sp.]MDR2236109.1 T9SS type A sorting domain-containing protein [Chryseobacterium sp.]
MRKKIMFLLFGVPVFGFAQSAIGNINSGAVSEAGFSHSVGEIYVIPDDPDQSSSGTMGMLYQTVLHVLGVSEIEKESVKVYPNPTADFVHITLSSNSRIENAEVYDTAGRLVLKAKLDGGKLDLRSLHPGMYMISFKNPDIQPIKIIKKP